MRAARYYGIEDVRVEEVPEPECGRGQVKIAPAFVGICGTDLHEYIGGPTFAPTKPHPLTNESIPIIIGHEFSGVVTAVGSDVNDLSVGQNVVVCPTISCGSCPACKNGIDNACPKQGFIGLSGGGGGLSEALVAPRSKVLPLPDNVPLDIGALVEPLAVAWHAVSAAGDKVGPETTALVLGGGPIGLAVVQCLKAKNVKSVIVSEVAARRQQFAKDMGADYVLNPTEIDVVTKSAEISGVDGPDFVFDAAGVPASLKTACTAVRTRGTVVNIAIWEKETPFQPNMMVFREVNYKGVLAYNLSDFEAVIENIKKGAMKPEQMITSKIKLEDLVSQGYMPLIKEKDKHVKILVDIKA
ncbi:GroES-like protein [Rhizodiscina lignyota]|uniref:GroES-like protein n=1 Tax=Rhizodiscina lignyota TaxID=1504668 RepID=A0A9P4M5A1_9PEZI|nr:GroES-like protein [Rhizodiscina lignyota]